MIAHILATLSFFIFFTSCSQVQTKRKIASYYGETQDSCLEEKDSWKYEISGIDLVDIEDLDENNIQELIEKLEFVQSIDEIEKIDFLSEGLLESLKKTHYLQDDFPFKSNLTSKIDSDSIFFGLYSKGGLLSPFSENRTNVIGTFPNIGLKNRSFTRRDVINLTRLEIIKILMSFKNPSITNSSDFFRVFTLSNFKTPLNKYGVLNLPLAIYIGRRIPSFSNEGINEFLKSIEKELENKSAKNYSKGLQALVAGDICQGLKNIRLAFSYNPNNLEIARSLVSTYDKIGKSSQSLFYQQFLIGKDISIGSYFNDYLKVISSLKTRSERKDLLSTFIRATSFLDTDKRLEIIQKALVNDLIREETIQSIQDIYFTKGAETFEDGNLKKIVDLTVSERKKITENYILSTEATEKGRIDFLKNIRFFFSVSAIGAFSPNSCMAYNVANLIKEKFFNSAEDFSKISFYFKNIEYDVRNLRCR